MIWYSPQTHHVLCVYVALLALARADWVQISQHQYKKPLRPLQIITTPESIEEQPGSSPSAVSTYKNRIYINHSIPEPQWNRRYYHIETDFDYTTTTEDPILNRNPGSKFNNRIYLQPLNQFKDSDFPKHIVYEDSEETHRPKEDSDLRKSTFKSHLKVFKQDGSSISDVEPFSASSENVLQNAVKQVVKVSPVKRIALKTNSSNITQNERPNNDIKIGTSDCETKTENTGSYKNINQKNLSVFKQREEIKHNNKSGILNKNKGIVQRVTNLDYIEKVKHSSTENILLFTTIKTTTNANDQDFSETVEGNHDKKRLPSANDSKEKIFNIDRDILKPRPGNAEPMFVTKHIFRNDEDYKELLNDNDDQITQASILKDKADDSIRKGYTHEDVDEFVDETYSNNSDSSEKNLASSEASYESKVDTMDVFKKFVKVIADTIAKNTRRDFKSKIKYLHELKQNILTNIAERLEACWPDEGSPRRRRRARSEHHESPSSSESALMTISFLTFAVYLIKLVMQVVHKFKNPAGMMAPPVLAAVSRSLKP